MGIVRLTFTPLPEHVRTARLVATAIARRAGMDDVVDEIRLAVGEACARAVRRSEDLGDPEQPVEVELVDDEGLVVTVRDHAGDPRPGDPPDDAGRLSMTLVKGLTDAVSLDAGPGEGAGTVRLTWRRRTPD